MSRLGEWRNGPWVAVGSATGETREMVAEPRDSPAAVVTALVEAINAHDIDAFVALFAEDYGSRQPAHPDRAFRGRDQVRANWSEVFSGVPDFHADLMAIRGRRLRLE